MPWQERPYPPRLPPMEYPGHYEVRRVSRNGGIRCHPRHGLFSRRGLGGASVEVIASHIVLDMPDDHAQSRSRRHAKYPAATPSYARQNAGHHTGTPGFAMS
jgi:hypothetical protein